MRNASVCWLGIAVSLSVLTLACARDQKSAQLAALDDAYKSGVLSQAEYDAKKAGLQGSNRLATLDNLYQSGLMTKAEYDAKRSAILGQSAPAAPPAAAAAPQSAPAATPTAISREAPEPSTMAAAPSPQNPPAATSQNPAAGARSSYLILRKADILDQSGFERPIVSASMLLPTDWQYQGGTQWNVKDGCNPTVTSMRASGPDGRGFEVFPAFSWTWADDPRPLQLAFSQKAQMGGHACDVMSPMSAADFLKRNLPRMRPNAQIVALEPMPKLLQILEQQARQTEQMAVQYRIQQRVRPDIVRARLRYNVNGQSVEEWLVVTTMTTGTLGPSMTPGGQMTQAFSYNCRAAAVAERAPQGQLEASEHFFDMLVASVRVNPDWQRRVSGVAANNFKVEHEEIGKRVAINTQLGNDLSNIRRQGFENQQKGEDHVFGAYGQANRGVETYRNPVSGETWDLSNQYGHAWVNNRNEFVLSDQEGWDPNVALKGNWTPMEHVRQ